VTEFHSGKVNYSYRVIEFREDKHFKLCPNVSSRTYGS